MEMLKYLLLGSCFVIVFVESLESSKWPSAAELKPKDKKFILDNLNQLARIRGLSPPVSLLRANITKQHNFFDDRRIYKALYSAADGTTCEGEVYETAFPCRGKIERKCSATQQRTHCYPSDFPGLIL